MSYSNEALDTLLLVRSALDVAIGEMIDNKRLREDERYWREKYQELLNSSIKNSEAVSANMLMLALGGGTK